VRELGKHGGDRKSEKAKNQPSNRSLIQRGTTTAYTLAKNLNFLRRDLILRAAERREDGYPRPLPWDAS
jgi:hypothetical protein